MTDYPKITPFGDRSFLIDFGENISDETLEKVLFYKQKVEVINTYNSLLVSYMFTIEDVYSEFLRLEDLLNDANIPKKTNYKSFHIPVCYDEEFGLDLEYISKEKELETDEIINLHTSRFYQVYFIGFLPGFLYLGGLDERLHISRKKTPRRSVEKGSVGIGGNQTGIYPKSSPGGWQILGNCPVDLFNKNEDPPSPFSAGDKIKFESITKDEFLEIRKQVQSGNYKLKFDNHDG